MKILCLNPPFKTEYGRFSRTSRSPAITKSGTLYYPIWLCYAAGVLAEAGHQVKLIDSCAYEYNLEKTLQLTSEFKPQIAVLDTSTPSIYSDVRTGSEIKNILPDCFVVLMGTHPTALPEETLKLDGKIDAIAVAEADYTVRELAQKLSDADLYRIQKDITYRNDILSTVDGLAYRTGDKVCINSRRAFIENLDELPFVTKVYKKDLDIRRYFFSAGQSPMVMITTGRGCPARCFFCVYPQVLHGRLYRFRSAENVVGEFEYILNELPEVKSVGIEDDTFTFNERRLKQICQLLIDKGISNKINWWVNVRVNTLDMETMQLMKKAGCRLLIPGYESGSQQILNNIRKGISLKDSIEFTRNAKKAKLLIHGCFMVGNPGETEKTMRETLEFAKNLNVDTAQFFPLIVYPGTEAYQWAKSNSYLRNVGFDKWLTEAGHHNTVIAPEGSTAEELVAFCNKARRDFYLRPKYLLYKARQCLTDYQELKRTLRSFVIFRKHLSSNFKQKPGC